MLDHNTLPAVRLAALEGPVTLEALLHEVVSAIPESEELWRGGWWLESMLCPPVRIATVEELDWMYRERERRP